MSMKIACTNEAPRQFRPYCNKCGWRKGGPDSWNGAACKCGETEPPLKRVEK